jgi:serine/threonine protein kinase
MDHDRSRLLIDLFQRAVALSDGERSDWIDEQCDGDAELRERLERLLADDDGTSPLLDEFDGLARLERDDPMLARSLGPYRIVDRVARGGMGVVYRAVRTDGVFDREVAIKLVGAGFATPDTIRRFEQERRALALLDHENIARLYDGGETVEGIPYFVMEYVAGSPIDTYCDRECLSVSERLQLFASICRTVHFAHQNLVVHRDLKPSNILIDERGSPKLLDFGIARIVGEEGGGGAPEVTRTQTRILTPEYASPEQLSGGQVTTATDVYSLGVVLYGLLTGRRPFHMETHSPAEWERRVSEEPPTRPSAARPRAG